MEMGISSPAGFEYQRVYMDVFKGNDASVSKQVREVWYKKWWSVSDQCYDRIKVLISKWRDPIQVTGSACKCHEISRLMDDRG